MSLKRAIVALLLVALLTPVGPADAQRTEADVYVAEAIVQIDERRFDAALANLRRALQIEPDHLEAIYYTGIVHMARLRADEAVPFLERARRLAPGDPVVAYQLGLAHFALQQYDRAEPLIEGAFRAQPSLDGAGYYAGYLRYRKKNYRAALDAFRAARASDPEVQQLTRVYTAATLGILGLPAQAATEVEEALRLAPGSAVTGVAERLRETIVAARGRERRLTAEVRVGFFYDDNVAVAPDFTSREPLVRDLRTASRRSTGELGSVRLDYALIQTPDWGLTAGYSLFSIFDNDLPDFNITSHLVSLGSTYRTTAFTLPLQLGSAYTWDILFLDEDEFLQRNSVVLFATLVESERHLSQAIFRYQRKEFNEATPKPFEQEIRDGNNFMIGGAHFLRFAQDRHYLRFGYQWDMEETEGRNYRYIGHRLIQGGQYTLPWQAIRLRYDLDVHLRRYIGLVSILPSPHPGSRRRTDEEITLAVRAEWPLPWKPPLGELTLAAEYQKTANHSNIKVFDFVRNVFSLQLAWSY